MGRVNLDGLRSEYSISDLDTTNEPKYFGFVDKYGNWYIMKLTNQTARYATSRKSYVGKEAMPYAVAWSNRASLAYEYFDQAF